jgi:transketolase
MQTEQQPCSPDAGVQVRRKMLEVMYRSGASHIGSCLSVIEILTSVYASVDLDKIRAWSEDRDRVVVSKGHCAAALYTVLNYFGLLKDELLETYYREDSLLGGHVTATVPYVEHSTGALGHGLSVAAGIALGLKSKHIGSRVFVIVGDGELHEGSNWEALQAAAHFNLGNLCLLVDYNKLSGVGETNACCNLEPLPTKLEAFGFKTADLDGHSIPGIRQAIRETGSSTKPVALICHTTKGKGVSFMENNNVWHYRPLNREDFEQAVRELGMA